MDSGKIARFNEGDILFNAGDESREMYIIRTGTVKVLIKKGDNLIPLTDLGSGSYIGEMSFLTGTPRSATVKASTPVTAAIINPEILKDENLGLSTWAVSLAKVLVRRIRRTTEILGSYITKERGAQENKNGEKQETESFSLNYNDRESPSRLYLRGILTEKSIEPLKSKIREIKLKTAGRVILDFSDVIDIDQAGINYLYVLSQNKDVSEGKIQIENVQLIRDKVLSIKGIQDILTTTHTPVKRVEKGEILIKQGEADTTMYVVRSGSFSIYRETGKGTVKLAKAESGDVIGEMALIKEGPRSANVAADKPSVVHVIDTREFYKNTYNVPGWFMELIQGLVQRLRDTDDMLETILKAKKGKSEKAKRKASFCILFDDTKPGVFYLKGILNLTNMAYVKQAVIVAAKKGVKSISVDLSRVKQIDNDSVAVFLNLFVSLKKKGIDLSFEGPQKSITYLFQQYGIDKEV